MTYDAVLVARRGLGADELRLAAPGFLDAVRWSVWAEHLLPALDSAEAAAEREPNGLTGQKLNDAIQERVKARERKRLLRQALLLDDGDG